MTYMRNTLVTDPVTKRLMQEQRFAEMDVLSWKQTVKEQGRTIERKENTIVGLQSTITQQGNTISGLQSTVVSQAQELRELAEYRRRFGNLNTFLN